MGNFDYPLTPHYGTNDAVNRLLYLLDYMKTNCCGSGGGGGGNVNLTGITGVAPAVGSGASNTGTLRTILATDQSAIPVSQSGTWNIGSITTVPSDPFGLNADAASATGSISAKLRFIAATGIPLTSIIPGTGSTSLGKAEDAAHTTGDTGVFSLGVANEAQSTTCADGDYSIQATDTKGNRLTVGNLANDAVDAGNPVKIGFLAKTSLPTAVADADRVNGLADKFGRQIVNHAIRDNRAQQATTITSSTSETTIVTGDASNMLDLYGLVISNTSSTFTSVTIKDSTAGTTRFIFSVPAQETRGFMLPSCDGHKQSGTNQNWTATCGTSVASVNITAFTTKNSS